MSGEMADPMMKEKAVEKAQEARAVAGQGAAVVGNKAAEVFDNSAAFMLNVGDSVALSMVPGGAMAKKMKRRKKPKDVKKFRKRLVKNVKKDVANFGK